MTILRIQHSVPAYAAWKRAFDADPVDRRGGGVLRYQVHQSVADPCFVVIDLHFDGPAPAEAFLERLRQLWNGPGKAVMRDPEAWILETVESSDA